MSGGGSSGRLAFRVGPFKHPVELEPQARRRGGALVHFADESVSQYADKTWQARGRPDARSVHLACL